MAKTLPQDQIHIENCAAFCAEVEALVEESNQKAEEQEALSGLSSALRLSYVDAVLLVAERRKIETPTLTAAYLSPNIKSKMQAEWERKNMMRKSAKLPF